MLGDKWVILFEHKFINPPMQFLKCIQFIFIASKEQKEVTAEGNNRLMVMGISNGNNRIRRNDRKGKVSLDIFIKY